MRDILTPGVDGQAFLRWATHDGWGMQSPLIDPVVVEQASQELEVAGFLEDYTELEATSQFQQKGMRAAQLMHATLNSMVCAVEGVAKDHLPLFSVRVFEPGLHGTTVHRNHYAIGPWAIGVTLKGVAPFNVYAQDQLPQGSVQPLKGDDSDPIPLASMEANAGAGWTLYTANEQIPHSSGIVDSVEPRELMIFYGMQ